jgi:hypothetical protein
MFCDTGSLYSGSTKARQLSRQEPAALIERLLTTLDVGADIDAEELWLQEAGRRYQKVSC